MILDPLWVNSCSFGFAVPVNISEIVRKVLEWHSHEARLSPTTASFEPVNFWMKLLFPLPVICRVVQQKVSDCKLEALGGYCACRIRRNSNASHYNKASSRMESIVHHPKVASILTPMTATTITSLAIALNVSMSVWDIVNTCWSFPKGRSNSKFGSGRKMMCLDHKILDYTTNLKALDTLSLLFDGFSVLS